MNTELFVAEAVPGQVREIQRKLRELEESKAKFRRTLDLLVQFAIAQGVELFPAVEAIRPRGENGNAASPGGADGAAIRGESGEPASASKVTPFLVGRS